MTMTMATVRWATTQQATTTMMIGMSKEEDDDDGDGDGAMGDEVGNDGNGVMGDGATGYDNNNGDGTERRNNQDTHPYFRGK